MIEPGTQAPDFTLPAADGQGVTLSDSAGRWRVVYFYPRAGTPGCTTQACGVRDRADEYAAAGALVYGISADPIAAVKRFSDKQELNFTLLADEDHAVCERYGTWQEKQNYGKTYWGIVRSTFIIEPEGVVAHVIPKVSPKTHDDAVLAVLGELQSA